LLGPEPAARVPPAMEPESRHEESARPFKPKTCTAKRGSEGDGQGGKKSRLFGEKQTSLRDAVSVSHLETQTANAFHSLRSPFSCAHFG